MNQKSPLSDVPVPTHLGVGATETPTSLPRSADPLNIAQKPRSPRFAHDDRELKSHLMNLEALLAIGHRGGASDILLKVGVVPMFRLNGELYPLKDGPKIERNMIEIMAGSCLPPQKIHLLGELNDVDTAYVSPAIGRVRINLFRQRGELGMCIRLIAAEVPSIESLSLAPICKSIAESKRGLVLVTGATGSGKSTTLAALVEHINRQRTAHVITIEDPIEFVFSERRSMINQRELGLDYNSFAGALKSALRQSPDVILVGELRDAETMEIALQASETGHLVLSTIHTNDAADALTRILSSLGAAREATTRSQLAENVRAIISQRLVKRADKKGRIAAQEILVNTATIKEKILKGANPSIVRDFISQGQTYGMQTFDQHLFQLWQGGLVDYDEAYNNATNRDDFDLKCRGVASAGRAGA